MTRPVLIQPIPIQPVRLRSAVAADLDGVLALYRHLNPDDPPVPSARAEAVWQRLIGTPGTTVFLAEAASVPVGSCTLVVVANLTRGGRSFALIENVVTHAAWRRRGIGAAVLRAALDAAWAEGCYKVMLMTGSKRPATLRFYERAGFERTGKTAFQIRQASGSASPPDRPGPAL